ncbi:hypothetical protein G9A89_014898 [Geosiphon pyriformis]|nr:hypothetical protein G9A89_014898 [Geosiphon pyriformis]
MTGYSKPMQCLTRQHKSCKSVRMANTYEYQQHVIISNLVLRHDHLLILKKKKRNLSGKLIRSHGLTAITMNYHQYYFGMTTTKENRRKNLSETLTKPEKLTITRKN